MDRMVLRTLLLCFLSVTAYTQQRPNVIYIMSDDHDADAISAYNKTLIQTPNIDRLAKEGMLFTHCFVANSICSPVRATVLTGQHSHKNGITTNRIPIDTALITLPKLLRAKGYQTALIGKWHLHSLPTGFDYWKIYPGQGAYYTPRFIHMDNDTVRYTGYSTEILTTEAMAWMNVAQRNGNPFFLMFHHKAPHRNFLPAMKWLELFKAKRIPEPPSLYADSSNKGTAYKHQRMRILNDMTLCTDLKVDPEFLKDIPHLRPDSTEIRNYRLMMNAIPDPVRLRMKEIYAERGKLLRDQQPKGNALLKLKYQWYMQDYLACVASIDESVGKILDYLDSTGLVNNTIVIYTSDQGFYLGENGWFDKRFMYDVSMQTPLLVRWKGKVKPGTVNHSLIQNIDFAPTMLDLAGIEIPSIMQGLSLKPILSGLKTALSRNELYYHYYEYPIDHYVLPHLGIREKQYKLIYFYTVNEWELYDLLHDPSEKTNLIKLAKHLPTIARMKKRLIAVRKKYGDTESAGVLK